MHVWHEEKIATLLDLQPELLRSYRGFISPREVLSALFDQISDQIPNFGDAMFRMLQRDLREQRSAKLSQAGHLDDTPIPLDSVFVDLPYTTTSEFEDLFGSNGSFSQLLPVSGMLLNDLLEFTAMKLDPVSRAKFSQLSLPERFLVMGGPGQGKSTVGQFLAQIARVRLLQGRPSATLTPETALIVEQFQERLAAVGITTAGPPRYPLTIDLPTYADDLAKATSNGHALSLLQFLSSQIQAAATIERLDLSVLRRWLSSHPWLLVLDGLDEVPPSANRREVIIEIERFWDEAVAVNADVAMVISSRPQGYNDELDRRLYSKLEMSRLEPQQALDYAEKLSIAKIPTGERATVMSRMKEAATNNSTQLLMVSPLQVAIMIQIAAQGVPSANRWELFDEYRQVIVKRELGKRGAGSETLRKHKNVIDLVLRRAGLLLHLEAEQRGGSESYLTPIRLNQIAYDVLAEDQVSGDDLISGPAEIEKLATDRLVLLEQRVEGRIAFEVRSLQEYLAAAELMSGADIEVSDRIKQIVGRNHWSHVFRIAAAKTFADSDARKYRDTIMTAIDSVDAEPAPASVQRASSIAMELVLDGVAHQHPGYLRILLNKAFSHLALGPDAIDGRFAAMLWSVDAPFRDPIRVNLTSDNPAIRRAAWSALFRAIREPGDWADDLAIAMWPSNRKRALDLGGFDILGGSATRDKLDAEIQSATVRELLNVQVGRSRSRQDQNSPTRKVVGPSSPADLRIGILASAKPFASIRAMSLAGATSAYATNFTEDQRSEFRPLADFSRNPSITSLAAILLSWESQDLFSDYLKMTLPWPVLTLRSMVSGGETPAKLALDVEQGSFGDVGDWIAAENRWEKNGITYQDLHLWTTGKFFDRNVATVGGPAPSFITWDIDRVPSEKWVADLVHTAESAVGPSRRLVSWLATLAMAHLPVRPPLSGGRFATLIGHADGWLSTAVIKSCTPDDLNDVEVKSALQSCIFWKSDERKNFNDYPETADTLVRMLTDPAMGELIVSLAVYDVLIAGLIRNTVDLPVEHYLINANQRAIGYLKGILPFADAVPSIASDKNASTAQDLLLSNNGQRGRTEAEITLILTSLTQAGSTVAKRTQAIRQLSSILDTKSSTLNDKAVWNNLKLPNSLFEMVRRPT